MSYTEKRHDRAVCRKNDYRIIERKKRILESYSKEVLEGWTNNQFHRLAKGKIHCSCPMCRSKTRERGWKHSDQVKLAKGWSDNMNIE